LLLSAYAQTDAPNAVSSVEKEASGIQIAEARGATRIEVCAGNILRVRYSPTGSFSTTQTPMVLPVQWPATDWSTQSSEDNVTLATSELHVEIARKDGAIAFLDRDGKKLFEQTSLRMWPVEVNGEKTFHAELFSNLWGSEEGFYGLGQHQAGAWNYRGESVELSQDNTNISVPFVLSSRGYGIFWNTASRGRFNNRFLNALYWSAEVADEVDYYFFYGPEFDRLIGAYRELTGAPPLFGKWAYGFWQCKNRYKTQQEILGVAQRYREMHIPVDDIVQDWFWWGKMGDHIFNKDYPDPKGMVDELHREHFHLMISVWPFFEPPSANYDEFVKRHLYIAPANGPITNAKGHILYDPFGAAGRALYWEKMKKALFDIGVDAWWLDTTEPETEAHEDNRIVFSQTALGSGARYANAFPLMTTKAVYDGQRAASDEKRVFILTRSGFAGMQRNAAAVWSGDINGDWVFFRKQIPAGLNYSVSGLPYWTTDIGGFVSGDPNDEGYRELFVRWFQFGVFNAILRVHGTRTTNQNELWSYGPDAQKILVAFDTLRYRLLPYIYSVAWQTTAHAYTPMRPLVMDYRTDVRAANVADEFSYGPAFLVGPVTNPGARQREMYLPGARWYDFWSGKAVDGGVTAVVDAPLDREPLFVKAGTILPLGPELEWSMEKTADPLEIRVYAGSDGDFTLYEDEGDSYRYEKGAHAEIAFHWDDSRHTLAIGPRQGSFPGMLQERKLQVLLVAPDHGVGISTSPHPDKLVTYKGESLQVELNGK
jgi:alpha-D-xyloside xylohydrolase